MSCYWELPLYIWEGTAKEGGENGCVAGKVGVVESGVEFDNFRYVDAVLQEEKVVSWRYEENSHVQ
jgi:hypothetical protein